MPPKFLFPSDWDTLPSHIVCARIAEKYKWMNQK